MLEFLLLLLNIDKHLELSQPLGSILEYLILRDTLCDDLIEYNLEPHRQPTLL